MDEPTKGHGCPSWCTADHHIGDQQSEHRGRLVELARPEIGTGACTARLVSDGDATTILIERWIRNEWEVRLNLETTDTILDALDDGGRVAIQSLAQLVTEGSLTSPPVPHQPR